MKHQLLTCSLLALLAATTGCAMCGSPFDYTYSTYGGKWQRDDETSGRVGSLFEPAGPMPAGNGESTVPANVPTTAPSRERASGPVNPNDAPPLMLPAPKAADAAPAPGTLIK
jgi:hypothetical protein